MCMEPLSILLDDAVRGRKIDIPHRCKALSISHLMFADDLMIFSKAKMETIKETICILKGFSLMSGLEVNYSKSSIILSGIDDRTRSRITAASGFQEGFLPISYLGVPLVQASITARDCDPIILRIRAKIESWKCRFLSHAGRLQLISSVLQSSYLYWAGLFGLPRKTCIAIESILVKFLWTGPELKKKAHFVSWSKVCLPKSEGGLGIRRVRDMCTMGAMKHFWSIIANKNSLWVHWMKRKFIKKDSIWTAKNSKNFPWFWRNLLLMRDMMKRKICYCLGSGTDTLFWLDPWLGGEPFWNRIENAANLIPLASKMESVKDFWEGDSWRACPHMDVPSFRMIWEELTLVKLEPTHRADRILWSTTRSSLKDFTPKEGWESCRNRAPLVPWSKSLWFSSNIPKHSFVTWRACIDALPTAEQLQIRNIAIPSSCRLCGNGMDSCNHLFFDCIFSSSVWHICMSRCIPRVGRPASCATEALRLASIKESGRRISCIPKLMFNAITYHIWKERNSRSFGDKKKSIEGVARIIIHDIEDKLSSMAFHSPSNPLEVFICTKWTLDVH